MSIKKIAIITSGGDAPGMNAAITAVVKAAARRGIECIGIKRGFNGLLTISAENQKDLKHFDLETVLDNADRPGTQLRTARCDDFRKPEFQKKGADTLRALGVDAVVVIGGDGSFQGALRLVEQGIPCVGIPGTIDNDLAFTEMTLGYETAVQVCTEAIRDIRATSRSHNRPHVVECMGRHCGDVALKAACATGAEIVLVPEVKWDTETVAQRLCYQIRKENPRATIVIAEGCWDSMLPFDAYAYLNPRGKKFREDDKMNASFLASILQRKCIDILGLNEGSPDRYHDEGDELAVRSTVVGYTQRGRMPVAKDSAFAFEAGHLAVSLLCKGYTGQAIGTRHGQVFHMDMAAALKEKKTFRNDLYDLVNDIRD